MIGLTPIQQDCLDFLRSYHAAHGVTPTCQEIVDHFGWHSRSNAARLLETLEKRGHIRRVPGKARAIEFVDPAKMSAVLLSDEVFRLVQAYAASQRISVDCAASELLRDSLGAA